MIIDDKPYDLGMTLILGAVGSDGIAIVGDGRGTITGTRRTVDDFRKVYEISDDIYMGVAINGVHRDGIEQLSDYLKRGLQLGTSFTMAEVGIKVRNLIDGYSVSRASNFTMQLVIGGYSRGIFGQPVDPSLIYIFVDGNNQAPTVEQVMKVDSEVPLVMAGNTEGHETIIEALCPETVEAIVPEFVRRIRAVAQEEPAIGGKIVAVVIKPEGATEIKDIG